MITEARMRGRRIGQVVAVFLLGAMTPLAAAQPEVDELLRTAQSRWSAAVSWLKKQRDSASAEAAAQIAEAQRQLDELKVVAEDTAAPARLRVAKRDAEN